MPDRPDALESARLQLQALGQRLPVRIRRVLGLGLACCYVAAGPGRYAAIVNAGGFEIYIDGEIAVWGWGGTDATGVVPAEFGQTVTVVTQCDRGVYCAAYGAFGTVVAADGDARSERAEEER